MFRKLVAIGALSGTMALGAVGIASATTPKQRVLVSTLEKLAADAREQKFEPPAIVVIGEIVEMRSQLLGDSAVAQSDSP